jgi:hypothetical protein
MQIHADFRRPQFLRPDQPMESIGKPVFGAIKAKVVLQNFCAKIPKPGPPQAESVIAAARRPRIAFMFLRRTTSNQTVSRDVEAPDGLAEMPAAEIDE